ncbi:hypothetical protein Pcinc_020437 [Petrolisthes cinctipes]|uniref:Uncharacterized protein n=1 Tax=Petrolisthes cinctipes TaxID=88211 RepID=A0AAE1FI34_PETCI|nr:hypothetical protein Pcinc_020437 [Petrolisthes cinctipes]
MAAWQVQGCATVWEDGGARPARSQGAEVVENVRQTEGMMDGFDAYLLDQGVFLLQQGFVGPGQAESCRQCGVFGGQEFESTSGRDTSLTLMSDLSVRS